MGCAECILRDASVADRPLEDILDELVTCEDCTACASGPPPFGVAFALLRRCAHALRKVRSKLRQREEDLAAALAATAAYEERLENVGRAYRQSTRELEPQLAVVERQAATIRALSAPILEVGDRVVAMPIIGSLDGEREKVITNALLMRVQASATRLVILELTGLEEVDHTTLTLLVRTCSALGLLGAKVALCGLRSRIAMEMVRLGADIAGLRTFPTLRAALEGSRRATTNLSR